MEEQIIKNIRRKIIQGNIKRLRKKGGFTQEQMAEKIGLSGKSSFRAYESGDSLPRLEKAILIAQIFDVTLDDLVMREIRFI